MVAFISTGVQPYLSPSCRVVDVDIDLNFLASGDYGGKGYPGDDLDPGDEYNF